MALCRFGDLLLESDFPLQMATFTSGVPSCTLLFPQMRPPLAASVCWFHHFVGLDDESWLSLGKLGSDYVLRFRDLIDFLVSSEGTIRGYPTEDTPADTIRHLFLDQVMPRVLGQQGRVVLHASAVRAAGGAIAFLGDSGSGKSTLSADFGRVGFPVVTDDCLLLKEVDGAFFAVPTHTGTRLWPDTASALFGDDTPFPQVAHYSDKRWVGAGENRFRVCAETVPLREIYVLPPPETLRDSESVGIAPLGGPDALMALVNAAFRLDLTDRERLGEEFEKLGRLSASVRAWRLSIPRDLTQLPLVREAISRHVETQGWGRCTA